MGVHYYSPLLFGSKGSNEAIIKKPVTKKAAVKIECQSKKTLARLITIMTEKTTTLMNACPSASCHGVP